MYSSGTEDSSSAADRSERVTGVNIAIYSEPSTVYSETPASAFYCTAHSATLTDLYSTCVDDLCMHDCCHCGSNQALSCIPMREKVATHFTLLAELSTIAGSPIR